MPGKIFVNYRRGDERSMAARIRDRLAQTFGDANIFMDVDNLLAGQRFDRELEKALAETDVFIAVIGPRWMELLSERQASGERDYVREEIAGALKGGIVVIPVLVERTPLPRVDALPEDIRELVLHQTHDVVHTRFGRDVAELVEAIKFARKAAGGRISIAIYSPIAILAAVAVVTIVGGALAMWVGPTLVAPGDAKQQSEQAARAKETEAARVAAEKTKRDEAERQRLAMLKVEEDRRVAVEAKHKADEAERQRIAKLEEDRRAATEAKRKAEEDAKRGDEERKRAEVERQHLAMLKAQEDAKRAEEEKKRAEAKRRAEEEAARRDPALSVKPGSGESFRDCPDCPEMVVVPAGSFVMGSPPKEAGRQSGEAPLRTVTIARPFAVGKYEVTFAEWDGCVTANGCKHSPGDQGWSRDRWPVINVSWYDITQQYLPWLSRKTGKTYRLPTEAEWEYAARAGTTTPFWWGSSISTGQANYKGSVRYRGGSDEYRQKTLPADSFAPNPWGLYNVHGNVWEWVEDCWNRTYQGAPTDGSARTTGDCGRRVLRGGSWSSNPGFLRSAFRLGFLPVISFNNDGGFRLARNLD